MPLFTGDENNNTLNGSAGDDTILGLGGNDSLLGNNGNDWIDGGLGADTKGGTDNDRLDGRAGDSRLEGGLERDIDVRQAASLGDFGWGGAASSARRPSVERQASCATSRAPALARPTPMSTATV